MDREAAESIALRALAHILSDSLHTRRFMALSGLSPETIRHNPEEPGLLAGALDYFLNHEPDLVAFCDTSGLAPDAPARARATLL